MIDRAAGPFKHDASSQAREQSIRQLVAWRPFLPDGVIGRRAAIDDDLDAEAFALAYRQVTGVDLRLWGRMGDD